MELRHCPDAVNLPMTATHLCFVRIRFFLILNTQGQAIMAYLHCK